MTQDRARHRGVGPVPPGLAALPKARRVVPDQRGWQKPPASTPAGSVARSCSSLWHQGTTAPHIAGDFSAEHPGHAGARHWPLGCDMRQAARSTEVHRAAVRWPGFAAAAVPEHRMPSGLAGRMRLESWEFPRAEARGRSPCLLARSRWKSNRFAVGRVAPRRLNIASATHLDLTAWAGALFPLDLRRDDRVRSRRGSRSTGTLGLRRWGVVFGMPRHLESVSAEQCALRRRWPCASTGPVGL